MEYLRKVSLKEAQDTLTQIRKAQTYGIVKEVKEKRTIHRFHKRGFSNDKERSMRHVFKAPLWLLFHPEYSKYFPKCSDPKERQTHFLDFMRLPHIKTPWGEKISPRAFLVTDTL